MIPRTKSLYELPKRGSVDYRFASKQQTGQDGAVSLR